MKGIFRKSDGSYVDNEQSWAVVPGDLAAAAASKHGGNALAYVVKETPKPWLRKLSGSKLVDDQEKLSALKERAKSEKKAAAAQRRIAKRRVESDLKLAEEAGDDDALALLTEEMAAGQ